MTKLRDARSIRGGVQRGSLLALLSGLLVWPGGAVGEQTIPIRLVDGQPCARCVLATGQSVPANVVVDLGLRAPLLVHEGTASILGLDQNRAVDVRFDQMELPGLTARIAGLESLEELTRNHAADLGDLPAVAVLGLPAFAGYAPQLDLPNGVLRLLPSFEPGAEPQLGDNPNAAVHSVDYTVEGHGHWLPVAIPGDGGPLRLRARFATAGYDTVIDATVAALADAPAGDVPALQLGPFDIARYVALRPADLATMPEPTPDVVIGTNFLSHFRVTVDTSNERMLWERMVDPDFPHHEQALFRAFVNENPDAVEAFIESHRSSRLAEEAGEALLRMRMQSSSSTPEERSRALRLRALTLPGERRAEVMADISAVLLETDRSDKLSLARQAAEIGLEYASMSLSGTITHALRGRLGVIALRQGDLEEAHRQLLSAAFGAPKDPQINTWMGQYYETIGKRMRAWSRYVQAALDDEPPAEALRELDELNQDPSFRASFSMRDAEHLLEGRMLEFHPAGRFVRDRESPDVRGPHLFELFTCQNIERTCAAELAFHGLAEYYKGTDSAFVAYHVPTPQPDPLANDASIARAEESAVERIPMLRIDGTRTVALGGSDKEIDTVYRAYVAAARSTQPVADGASITGRFTMQGDRLNGRVDVTLLRSREAVRVFAFLVERVVMSRGGNGLILHRFVARSMLSPAAGWAVGDQGRDTFLFDRRVNAVKSSLEESLQSIERKEGIRFLIRPTYVDASMCRVVVFAEDADSGQILAATTISPEEEPTEP